MLKNLAAMSCVAIFIGSLQPGQAEIRVDAFSRSLVGSLESAGRKLMALAEAIPADEFSWKPSDEVRSISQVFMHVVGNNFQIPATLGADPPEGIDTPARPYDRRMQKLIWEEDVREKARVIDLLEASFDYAVRSIPEISDLDEMVSPLGFRASKRDYRLLLVNHAHEHLGQSIVYARSAGVVPPWSLKPEQLQASSVAVLDAGEARGAIVSVDRFGNILTNLVETDLEWLDASVGDEMIVQVGEHSATVFWGESMMDVGEGEWFTAVTSNGIVMIGRSYENAAATLDCRAGDSISIRRID